MPVSSCLEFRAGKSHVREELRRGVCAGVCNAPPSASVDDEIASRWIHRRRRPLPPSPFESNDCSMLANPALPDLSACERLRIAQPPLFVQSCVGLWSNLRVT